MFLETPRLARACFAFTEKRSMLTLHLCHQSTAWTLKSDREVREVVKKRIFYGQADRKERVSHLGPDRKQILIFSFEIVFFDTQNTFYVIVKGLKNAVFMPISSLSR